VTSAAESVTVAYVHHADPDDVSHSWHRSLLELVGYDLATSGRILGGGWLSMSYGADGLVGARNRAAKTFLEERTADWLLWLDTDMGFAPDMVERLVQAADPVERPIVGGLCFAYKQIGDDGFGGWHSAPRPTIFDWVADGDQRGFKGRTTYPVNALVRCAGTGSACLLIHRSVFERIRAEHGEHWYDKAVNPSTRDVISEDLSFCMRAGTVGVPVFVHTGVRTSHAKRIYVSERDYWAQAVAPPATDSVAVVVPVLRRPQNAAPFMSSLRASTGLATAYAVADDSDEETQRAWRAEGATVIGWADDDGPGTFAEKINVAYRRTGNGGMDVPDPLVQPWLLLTGDDVRFHAGWLDHAQAAAGDRYHVVGTNDLANPRVVVGEHATHLLVRRSYVDEQGASWDGPKTVAHEGYRHWYVDDEIVTAAKQRGVWAMALGSRVEHLHPLFGTAPDDDVYELGRSFTEQDGALFRRRLAEYGG
jgi:hypothetical protein